MTKHGFVLQAGEGLFCELAPGRSTTIKVLNKHSAESVMMFEEVAPPDTATDLHLHRDSNEIAYVLAGEITFNIGGETWVGGPGACAFMPRGVPHAWKSTGKEPGRALFLYAPGRAGRFFEEVTELAPIAPEQIHAVIGTLVQRYGWESVGPSPF